MKKLVFPILIFLSISYWGLLYFKIPLFQNLYYWFWDFTYKNLPMLYLVIPVLIFLLLIFYLVNIRPHNLKINLILIIFTGFIIQTGFIFTEGKGLSGLEDKISNSGHSEFIKIAAKPIKMGDVVYSYESLLKSKTLGKYSNSKPPGTLLFYMGMERIADYIFNLSSEQDRYVKTVTVISYIFPFLTYLILIPLFFISKKILDEKYVYYPLFLYILMPNVTLITGPLDQVLFPLLFCVCIILIFKTFETLSNAYGFISGIFIYISLYFSFSLIPIIPLIILGYLICLLKFERYKQKKLTISFLFLVSGFLASHLAFFIFFNYNFYLRYYNAIEFHKNWKGWKPTFNKSIYFAFLDYIEFGIGTGISLSILFIYYIYGIFKNFAFQSKCYYYKMNEFNKSIASTIKYCILKFPSYILNLLKNLNYMDLSTLSFVIIILLLGIFGKTKAETARLWIFLVPSISLIVSYYLINERKDKDTKYFTLLMFLQYLTIIFLKISQDFEHNKL